MPCPLCQSTRLVFHAPAKKLGGLVGATGGAISGAASASAVGAASAATVTGAKAGAALAIIATRTGPPLAAWAAVLMGCLAGGATGCIVGAQLGDLIDRKVLDNVECKDYGHRFQQDTGPEPLHQASVGFAALNCSLEFHRFYALQCLEKAVRLLLRQFAQHPAF